MITSCSSSTLKLTSFIVMPTYNTSLKTRLFITNSFAAMSYLVMLSRWSYMSSPINAGSRAIIIMVIVIITPMLYITFLSMVTTIIIVRRVIYNVNIKLR